MNAAEIIRELDDYGALRDGGSACLVKLGPDYFVVSSIPDGPEGGGPETLAFAANDDGEITDWADVAGGRGWSREETIKQLEVHGPDRACQGRGLFGDTQRIEDRDAGEVVAGFMSALATVADSLERDEA